MRLSPAVRFCIRHPRQATIRVISIIVLLSCLPFAVYSKGQIEKVGGPNDNESQISKENTDAALALYTLWLTMFTGALAVSTIGLWLTTKKGMRDQSEDMKRSIAASNTAATAAVDAAISSKQTADAARDSARAHLRITKIGINASDLFAFTPTFKGGIDLFLVEVTFDFKNYGLSPADVTYIRAGAIIAPKSVGPTRGILWDESAFMTWSPTTIGKEENIWNIGQDFYLSCSTQQHKDLIVKRTFLHVRLEIFYHDVFTSHQIEDVIWRYDFSGSSPRRAQIVAVNRNPTLH